MVTRRTIVGGLPGLMMANTAWAQEGKPGTVPTVTKPLAEYLAKARFDDLPPPVRREAVRTLLNWVATALGGAHHTATDRACAAVIPFAGKPQAGLIARRERLDAMNAALLNGIAGHVLDFDDTHLPTVIHPSTAVVPVLLAMSEYKPIGGADLLNALVLGVETSCRIGNAVSPEHYDIGWHITGTAGVFGAAAATARLLGLDARQTGWALGIAASQPVGLQESLGYMNKSFNAGRAAANGMMAAFLAAQNFESSDRMIEAPHGWAPIVSTKQDYAQITEGLGTRFEILRNAYKPFPCGVVMHPSLDAALKLRAAGVKAQDVARIDLKVHPRTMILTGRPTPTDGMESKFSVYHGVAVALIVGAAGEKEFSAAAVNDPRVLALRAKVFPVVESSLAADQVDMTVTLKDGTKRHQFITHAIGSANTPMTDAEIDRKFLGLADGVVPAAQAQRIMALCRGMEGLKDAGELSRSLQIV